MMKKIFNITDKNVKYLEDFMVWFLNSRGLDRFEKDLLVCFSNNNIESKYRELKKGEWISGTIFVYNVPKKIKHVPGVYHYHIMLKDQGFKLQNLLCFAHELTHLNQICSKRYCVFTSTWDGIEYNKARTRDDYLNLPWEIEARSMEYRLIFEYYKERMIKWINKILKS